MGSILEVLEAGVFGSIDTVLHIAASAVRGALDAVSGVFGAGGSSGSAGQIDGVYGSLQDVYGIVHSGSAASMAPDFHG